jgi:hypothetical protein
MRARKSLIFLFCLTINQAWAQLSPPGLGVAHTVDWLAFGVRQDLDSLHRWQSMSYVGLGRKSNPDNYNLLYKPAILVLNQEFYYRFRRHWQQSFALSYRHQDVYAQQAPFEHTNPPFEQEFRAYSRLSYLLETPRLKFVPTLRQEFRKFYTPAFTEEEELLQLRTRFRLQVTVALDAANVHRLIGSSEQLFSTSKLAYPGQWTRFAYQESRFTLYYSLSPTSLPFTFDLGYMADRLGTTLPLYVHYVAVDVIWKNPFGNHKAVQAPHMSK